MRKLNVLNVNREPVGLDVPFSLLDGHTLRDVYENGAVVDLTDEDDVYFQAMYDYLKTGTKVEGKTYLPAGNSSKHDIAYINKTNDIPYNELGGKTLNDMFSESRNLLIPYNMYLTPSDYSDQENEVTIFDEQGLVAKYFRDTGNIQINGTFTGNSGYMINIYYIKPEVQYLDLMIETPLFASLYYVSGFINNNANSFRAWYYPNILDQFSLPTVSEPFKTKPLHEGAYYLFGIRLQQESVFDNYTFKAQVEKGNTYSPYQLPSINYSSEYFPISFTEQNISNWFSIFQARKNIVKRELTYADIFEKINVLQNSQFKNDITNWYASASNLSFDSNGYLKAKGNGGNPYPAAYTTNEYPTENAKYYMNIKTRVTNQHATLASLLIQKYNSGVFVSNHGMKTQSLPEENKWYELSNIISITPDGGTQLRFTVSQTYIDAETANGKVQEIDYAFAIDLKYFDENITKDVLNDFLSIFLSIQDNIVYPNLYLITEPIGLGKRYRMLSVGDYIHGHELDFQEISFKMLFGFNYNAYEAYNLMVNMLKDDECTIEYDWGKGSRFADVRLLEAPKTEKETRNLLISKWRFQLLNSFYQLKSYVSGSLINESHLSIDLFLTITNLLDTSISIEFENDGTEAIDFTIAFDLSSLATQPTTIYIDSEKKKIYDNLGRNLYEYLDLINGDASFISIDPDVSYTPSSNDCDLSINWKHWVVD